MVDEPWTMGHQAAPAANYLLLGRHGDWLIFDETVQMFDSSSVTLAEVRDTLQGATK